MKSGEQGRGKVTLFLTAASSRFLVVVPKLWGFGVCGGVCVHLFVQDLRECFEHTGIASGMQGLFWARIKCFGHTEGALGRLEMGLGGGPSQLRARFKWLGRLLAGAGGDQAAGRCGAGDGRR